MLFYNLINFVCFDNEENSESSTENNKTEQTKTFTQDEVNAFLAKEKRKTQDAQKQLAVQLEQYKKTAELTTAEKEELELRIEELNKTSMTAEERARQAAEKAEKEYNERVQKYETESKQWKSRYNETIIETAILKAAGENNAVSVEQIAAMLRPTTRVVEKLDTTGKGTGKFEPIVEFPDQDKEGKPLNLNLTVKEAVKRMTELDKYSNLFRNTKNGGIGSDNGNNISQKHLDLKKLVRDDPARFRQLRKERKDLYK